jgi:hypothetical protein
MTIPPIYCLIALAILVLMMFLPAIAMKLTGWANSSPVMCAWCGRSLGRKSGMAGATSHGICPDCRRKTLNEFRA